MAADGLLYTAGNWYIESGRFQIFNLYGSWQLTAGASRLCGGIEGGKTVGFPSTVQIFTRNVNYNKDIDVVI